MDIIYRCGAFYKVSNKLFEYWLRYVYSLKTQAPIDDIDIRYLEFKRSIQDDYIKYCEFSSKSVKAVCADLFKKFKNEKTQINTNCHKMPLFDTVESQTLTGGISKIIGSVKQKKWV